MNTSPAALRRPPDHGSFMSCGGRLTMVTLHRPHDRVEVPEAGAPFDDRDDKTPTSPFAGQRWRGVWVKSRYSKAHELADMRDLVDRLHAADLAYAVERVFCDSKCGVYTVSLKPAARAPWRYLEAQVQAWLDAGWRTAFVEGEQFESDWLQGGDPEDEDGPRRHRLAEAARALLLGEPTAVRARMARRLVEDLEAALAADPGRA